MSVFSKQKASPKADYDGAWKETLERYLRGLVELCFPFIAAQIDWDAGFSFLDQELQKVVRDAKLGTQRVDKLVKVRLRNCEEQWILFHVEVASQPYVELERTMYQYHHRLEDRFGRPVLSVAVLTDDCPTWRPDGYEQELLGCRLRFEFPVCKLLDLAKDWEALSRNTNPAAMVVMAHVRAMKTRGDMKLRLHDKVELTRMLYKRGYDRKEVMELYRLIDWLLTLPKELDLKFKGELVRLEQEKPMPFITSIERIGREEASKSLILRMLRKRFGRLKPALRQGVEALPLRDLERLGVAWMDFDDLVALEKWLHRAQLAAARR